VIWGTSLGHNRDSDDRTCTHPCLWGGTRSAWIAVAAGQERPAVRPRSFDTGRAGPGNFSGFSALQRDEPSPGSLIAFLKHFFSPKNIYGCSKRALGSGTGRGPSEIACAIDPWKVAMVTAMLLGGG